MVTGACRNMYIWILRTVVSVPSLPCMQSAFVHIINISIATNPDTNPASLRSDLMVRVKIWSQGPQAYHAVSTIIYVLPLVNKDILVAYCMRIFVICLRFWCWYIWLCRPQAVPRLGSVHGLGSGCGEMVRYQQIRKHACVII
jgi:hypothetical protein